jgi:hypothetical protein
VADAGIADAQRDRQNWALRSFETWRGLQALQAGRLADATLAFEGRFEPGDASLNSMLPSRCSQLPCRNIEAIADRNGTLW